MNIIHKDFKKGIVKLKVTDKEDLWYLSHLIEAGDLLRGKTSRKIKIGERENSKTAKKLYLVAINAETVDFSDDGAVLRVNGKIREAPEEIPRDSYQNIPLEVGSEFTLEKAYWPQYQKQRLEESSAKKQRYLLCLFDREEAILALTKPKGVDVIVKLKGEVPKKAKQVAVTKDFQLEIINAVQEYARRYAPEQVIIASPAFYKEDLFAKMPQELQQQTILATCSDVSEAAFGEVIRSQELAKTLKSSRTREEKIVMDRLLAEIKQDKLACYGWNEVQKGVEAGAVETLLVTDRFIAAKRQAGGYLELDALMKRVDALKGKIRIISSAGEGATLDGLGGIAALLRYRL